MELTGKTYIVRGADPFTIRELREMTDSRAWNIFQSRLDLLIESALKTCEKAADNDAWRKAQGSLETLRRIKQLPQIIEGELEGTKT